MINFLEIAGPRGRGCTYPNPVAKVSGKGDYLILNKHSKKLLSTDEDLGLGPTSRYRIGVGVDENTLFLVPSSSGSGPTISVGTNGAMSFVGASYCLDEKFGKSERKGSVYSVEVKELPSFGKTIILKRH